MAANDQGGVEAVYVDEDVWLSQKMMGVLYDVNVHTINEHLKKIFADHELQEDSVIRKFRITASDGKTYDTQHYNLSGIIAVGYNEIAAKNHSLSAGQYFEVKIEYVDITPEAFQEKLAGHQTRLQSLFQESKTLEDKMRPTSDNCNWNRRWRTVN